jgi:hypothetical protein
MAQSICKTCVNWKKIKYIDDSIEGEEGNKTFTEHICAYASNTKIFIDVRSDNIRVKECDLFVSV